MSRQMDGKFGIRTLLGDEKTVTLLEGDAVSKRFKSALSDFLQKVSPGWAESTPAVVGFLP